MYKNFHLSLQLAPRTEVLRINVENTLSLEKYHKVIDPIYLELRDNLNCFKDPFELYDFIHDNFDKVTVEDGAIKFTYVWGRAVPRKRDIVIDLKKEDVSGLELANLRIDKLTY